MKKQIVVLHGGDAYASDEAHQKDIATKTWDIERLRQKPDWKHALPENLGDDYDVLFPKFPTHNAKYADWKVMFEGMMKVTDPGVYLVAHSLGAIFLTKYLAENTARPPIGKVFLIAAPFHRDDYAESDPDLVGFALPHDLSHIAEQADEVHLYHAPDDFVVPYTDFEKYKDELTAPNVHFHTLPEGYTHVFGPEFPEIIDDIHAK